MNQTFHSSKVLGHAEGVEDIVANILQLMTIPSSYINGVKFKITADLYSLFISV